MGCPYNMPFSSEQMGDNLFLVEAPFDPDYEYVDEEESTAVPVKRMKQECPGSGCSFSGTLRELRGHWAEVHHPEVLLWLCPIGTCQYRSRKEATMSSHWSKRHKLGPSRIRALQDLPSLVQLVNNKKYRNPGDDVEPLTAPETEPWGSLMHSARGSLQLEVQRALTTPASGRQEPCSLPANRLPVQKESTAGPVQASLRFAPSSGDIPVRSTPIVAQCTPTPVAQASLHPAPPTPASETVVISARDPRIVAIRQVTASAETPLRLSASPAIVISSPEEQACAPEEDLTFEPQETSESPSCGEGPESAVQPGPTATPAQDFPPAGEEQDNRGIQRSDERPPPLSTKTLRGQLRSLDNSVERLQKLRRDLQEDLVEASKRELAEKDYEVHLLRRRVSFLENQLERAEKTHGNGANPTTVGHLQRIGSMRAYILFPNVGQTAVYPLSAADLAMLDLRNRSEALSCEPL